MEGKDKKDVWFRARKYGYGWTPVTREGWTVTLLFIGALTYAGFKVERTGDDFSFLIFLFVSVVVFFLVAHRTGERPRWQWGKKKK